MPRKLEAYTEEILKSIEDIELFIQGLEYTAYVHDSKTKAAVERKLLNIGEALNQACQLQPDIEEKIMSLRKIIGFRNILAHVYFGVDDELVWDIIKTKLDQLKKDVKTLK